MKIKLVSEPGQVAATTTATTRTGVAQRTGAARQNTGKGPRQQGRPQQKKKELTAEELDADLDAFVSKAN